MNRAKTKKVAGIVVKGRGWISGFGETCPFPTGTIQLQLQHFRDRELDLGEFYPGALMPKVILSDPPFLLTTQYRG